MVIFGEVENMTVRICCHSKMLVCKNVALRIRWYVKEMCERKNAAVQKMLALKKFAVLKCCKAKNVGVQKCFLDVCYHWMEMLVHKRVAA